jgi:hypothetical protein
MGVGREAADARSPIGNVAPDGVEQVGDTGPSTRSVAVAAKSTAAPTGAVASTVIDAGTVSTGVLLRE